MSDTAHGPGRTAGWQLDELSNIGGGPTDGGWTRGELEEHVRDEHSTFTWLLEPMLVRAGFEVRDASYADDGFGARYLLAAR